MAIFSAAYIFSFPSLICNSVLNTKDADHWNLANSPWQTRVADFQPYQPGDKWNSLSYCVQCKLKSKTIEQKTDFKTEKKNI